MFVLGSSESARQASASARQASESARQAPGSAAASLSELVRAQLPWMLGVARAITGRADAAESLVQEALARALPHYAVWADAPRPYLRRTLTNLHIDDLRRRRLIEFVPDPELHERPPPPDDVDLKLDVATTLESMPPLLRLVVVCRFLEDLSVKQVAELIGQTPGSVRRLTHQALTLLRVSSLGDSDESAGQ